DKSDYSYLHKLFHDLDNKADYSYLHKLFHDLDGKLDYSYSRKLFCDLPVYSVPLNYFMISSLAKITSMTDILMSF
ncbi:hypothetical protein EI94DRAFT_430384, partial [Lactarius quietus]